MPRARGALVVTTCLATVLAACSSDREPQSSTPTGLAPAPGAVPEQRDDGSSGTLRPGSTLVLDEVARAKAATTAVQVMTLFARRTVSADQWWNDLVPLMTPKAAQAYKYTDPANVPPTKVTGAAKVTPASIPLVARVGVPTDAGNYLVILSRTDQSPDWLAERITPPEGPGDS
ncbi:MAG: hypothetical protein ABI746_10680 [Dermatophilaceae bacterium]